MNCVYSAGTEKPKQTLVVEKIKPKTGFFASLLGLGRGNTPQQAPSPLPQLALNEAEYLKVGQSSVMLAIFTAEVDVELDGKMSRELRRSTKKKLPRTLKYELIYVSHSPLPMPTVKHADIPFRRERMSMMQARRKTKFSTRQRAVYSKACARIWMGKYNIKPYPLSLTSV